MLPIDRPQRYLAVVFARYGSRRLPGKVLMTLGGETILGICLRKIDNLGVRSVVATSVASADDAIARFCRERGTACVRGDEFDVADRTRQCLEDYACEAFFRINADSPFLQADLLADAIARFERNGPDLVTNVLERTFPYGIAVELIRRDIFLSHLPFFQGADCEHITQYFYRHAANFSISNIRSDKNYSAHRLVLDTPEDWAHLQELYGKDSRIFDYNLSQLIAINSKET